jgi:hypothetical protein
MLMLIFSTKLCECCPSNLLLSGSTPPPPPPQCVRRGRYGVLGLIQINTCRKVLLLVNFLDYDILHCLLWVSYFYEPEYFSSLCVYFCRPYLNIIEKLEGYEHGCLKVLKCITKLSFKCLYITGKSSRKHLF